MHAQTITRAHLRVKYNVSLSARWRREIDSFNVRQLEHIVRVNHSSSLDFVGFFYYIYERAATSLPIGIPYFTVV